MNQKLSPRKIIRNSLVDFLYKICDSSKIRNKTLGQWVKAWHYLAPIGTLAAVILCNVYVATIALIGGSIAGILIIILQGCFLSGLEYKLTGDKSDNITNIFLEAFDYEITKKNQTKMTYIILAFYIPLIYGSYYYRFINQSTTFGAKNSLMKFLSSLLSSSSSSIKSSNPY